MKTTKLTVASLTPDCGAILGPSLAGCDCKCLPRRHICTKNGMRGHNPPRCIGAICDQKNAQRKQQCRVASYFASAMASTAACRTTLNFAPTRACGVPDCARASASRTRALATCAASWAPPNPHVAAICRKSATKAPKRDDAATTRLALLDALPATRGSCSPTATLHRER